MIFIRCVIIFTFHLIATFEFQRRTGNTGQVKCSGKCVAQVVPLARIPCTGSVERYVSSKILPCNNLTLQIRMLCINAGINYRHIDATAVDPTRPQFRCFYPINAPCNICIRIISYYISWLYFIFRH